MKRFLLPSIIILTFSLQSVWAQQMVVVDGQFVEQKVNVEDEKTGIGFKSIFDKVSFNDAVIKAKQQNSKVLIYFTATYCGACRVMEKVKFPNDSLPGIIKSEYIAIINNHDSCGTDLEDAYNVHAFPTFIIVNSRKEEIGRHIGRMELPDLIKFLSKKQ